MRKNRLFFETIALRWTYMEQILTFSTQKTRPTTYRCLLHLPEDMRPGERLPLIVFLHGAGERGDNVEAVRRHGPPKLMAEGFPLRAIVLAPQCAENDVWYTQTHELKELIDDVAARFPVDPDRISLTGISMGGFGAWAMAIAYPRLFSALAPLCGGGMSWCTPQLRDLPIRAFHGDCDTVVPPEYSLLMVQGVNAAGGRATLTLLPGVGHDCWTETYAHTDLLPWLAAQTRKG